MAQVWPWVGQPCGKHPEGCMSVIPTEYKLLGLAALIAGLLGYHFIAVHHARQSGLEKGRQEVRDEWTAEKEKQRASVAEKNADSAQKTSVLVQTKTEVVNAIVESKSTNADRGNATVERLRKLAAAHPAACPAVPQSAGASQADYATPVPARLPDDDRRSLVQIGVMANDVRDQLYGCRKLLHDAWMMTN